MPDVKISKHAALDMHAQRMVIALQGSNANKNRLDNDPTNRSSWSLVYIALLMVIIALGLGLST